jgi:NADPH:quinone reductase-like Zn-dependent oxidoreductase
MPRYAEIVVYGGLSGNPLSIDVLKLIFESKRISGFNLGDWIQQTGRQKMEEISDKLQQMFIDGILRTRIQKTITFDEIQQGLYNNLTKNVERKVIYPGRIDCHHRKSSLEPLAPCLMALSSSL